MKGFGLPGHVYASDLGWAQTMAILIRAYLRYELKVVKLAKDY